ncbi:hypothetical protein, partial [Ralstonia pseudosolanacearum]
TCWICSDVRRRSIQRSISLSNQPLSEDVADFLRIPANPQNPAMTAALQGGGTLRRPARVTTRLPCRST